MLCSYDKLVEKMRRWDEIIILGFDCKKCASSATLFYGAAMWRLVMVYRGKYDTCLMPQLLNVSCWRRRPMISHCHHWHHHQWQNTFSRFVKCWPISSAGPTDMTTYVLGADKIFNLGDSHLIIGTLAVVIQATQVFRQWTIQICVMYIYPPPPPPCHTTIHVAVLDAGL